MSPTGSPALDGTPAAGLLLRLPQTVLHHILLTATDHDNLLRFVSVCARVHSSWWQCVASSDAYAGRHFGRRGWGSWVRTSVMQLISKQLRPPVCPISLRKSCIGDKGARILAVAMGSLPASTRLATLILPQNNITARGLESIAPRLKRDGLRGIHLDDNQAIGDRGAVALAGALPSGLDDLGLRNIGLGDDGLVALSDNLPAAFNVGSRLMLQNNPAITPRGWAVLGHSLSHSLGLLLQDLCLDGCKGMGDAGIASIAPSLPHCTSLVNLRLARCKIGDAGAQALAAVLPHVGPALICIDLRRNEFENATPLRASAWAGEARRVREAGQGVQGARAPRMVRVPWPTHTDRIYGD